MGVFAPYITCAASQLRGKSLAPRVGSKGRSAVFRGIVGAGIVSAGGRSFVFGAQREMLLL